MLLFWYICYDCSGLLWSGEIWEGPYTLNLSEECLIYWWHGLTKDSRHGSIVRNAHTTDHCDIEAGVLDECKLHDKHWLAGVKKHSDFETV